MLLYAWNPLVVKEIAFTAHPDVIAVFLVLAAVVLTRKDRFQGAAVFLALAVGAKTLALPVVPFVLLRARMRDWGLFVAVLALIYMPFVLQGSTDLQTLLVFCARMGVQCRLLRSSKALAAQSRGPDAMRSSAHNSSSWLLPGIQANGFRDDCPGRLDLRREC